MADDTYNVELELTAQNRVSATVGGVTRDLDRIDDKLESISQENSRLQRSFGSLQSVMQGAFAGITLQAVTNYAEELYELGTQARVTSQTFEQLVGDGEAAALTMERLREATGNIVTDMDLMQGATRLMSMGLAENSTEAARLIELATRLGGAMGNDAASSIENFSLLLANESVLRLDSFGISSSRVKERIDELLASGEALNRSEAFKLAVLEEGANSLERLGDAASAAETPMARLQTRIENLQARLAEGFAVGVDTLMALGEGLAVRAEYNSAMRDLIAQAGIAVDPMTTALQRLTGSDPLNDLTEQQRQQVQILIDNARISDMITQRQREIRVELQQQADAARAAQAAETARAQILAENVGLQREYWDTVYPADQAFQRLNNYPRGTIDGQRLFTDEEAAEARRIAELFAAVQEQTQELFERGAIPEEWVSATERMVERTAAFADEAERGADALKGIRLSDIFDVQEGGMLGEVGDALVEYMRAQGFDEAAIENVSEQFDFASGRVTELSRSFEDELIPALARVATEAGGAEDAILIAERWLTAMQQAKLLGIDQADIAPYSNFLAGIIGTEGGGQQITVRPGDTVSGLAAQYGMSQAEIMRITGVTDPRRLMPGTYGGGGGMTYLDFSFDPLAALTQIQGLLAGREFLTPPSGVGGIETVSEDLDIAVGKATEVQTILQDISASIYKAEIELAVKDPNNILGILTGTAQLPPGISATTTIRNATRDNGGRVPGASGRARPEAL